MATTKKKQSGYDPWANTKAGAIINSIINKPYDSGGRQQPTYTKPSNKYNGDLIYSGAGKIGGGSTIPSVSDVFGPNSGNYDKWANTKAGSIVNNAISTTPTTNNGTKTTQTVTMPTSVGDLPTYNSEYMDQLNALARQLTSMNYDDWTKGSQYQALADR